MTNRILLFLIVVLGAFRFLWLGQFPPGLSNDETEYILSAKTYALFDRDVSGYGLPLSLVKSETDGVIAPMPSVLASPFYLFLPLNLATARLPYIIVNLLTAYGIYRLARILFNNKTGALITTAVFLANPWSIYLSRNVADAPFALLFYVWGIVYLLKAKTLDHVFAFMFFVLGFFSYHGAKTLYLPVIIVALIYTVIVKKSLSVKKALIFILSACIFFFAFFLIAKSIPGSVLSIRQGDIAVAPDEVTRLVDEARRQSISTPFTSVFANKYLATARMFIQKYLQAFDLSTLFLAGDYRATYRFENYGLFHLADIGFIFLGIVALARKKAKELALVVMVLVIAPLASMLSIVEVSVINRSFLLLLALCLLAGQGVYFITTSFTKKLKTIAISITLLVSAGSFMYFANFYLFTFPVTAQENYWVSERVLVSYLSAEPKPSVWISPEPWNSTMRAIFYADQNDQNEYLQKTYPLNQLATYQIGKTTITNDCPPVLSPDVVWAIPSRLSCHSDVTPQMTIVNQKDGGDVIRIYNGTLCQDYELSRYRRFNLMSDYLVESMLDQTLCERWFSVKL